MYGKRLNMTKKLPLKYSFRPASAKSRKCHMNLGGSKAFQTVLSSAGSQILEILNIKLFLIKSSHKKFYRKQPVEFLVTEHFFSKIRADFLVRRIRVKIPLNVAKASKLVQRKLMT